MERTVEGTSTFGGVSSNYEGGGVGGKLRRRLFRRSSTPYDRPHTATRNSSWMSKLVVDPASKLFNFGARRFFATVFPNKRLPPPTAHASVEEQERTNGLQETALDVKINSGLKEPVGDACGTSSINNDTSGLPELEQLLKQKNFTRSEIDHLTELLKSRATDLPVKDDRHGMKLNPSGQDSGRHQEFPTTSNINTSESSGAHVAVLDPAVTTREQDLQQHLEDRIASPAELAKAYMSSRPTKVSPSALGLRAQITREDPVALSFSPYTTKSQLSSLPGKTSGYSGVPENGFTTPRSRGRLGIRSMASTPYSRFNPVTHQKVNGSKIYGGSRPSLLASRSPSENGGHVASKPMALKRRSTVLDDEIGSIGPIRRIRQKHNLLPHGKSVTISGKGLGSDSAHSMNRYFMSNANIRGESSSSASYVHVPRESSEMAAKILEHLEKMTPKEKSPESKLAAAREVSTFKLTSRRQALRTSEDLDASKFLQNSHKDENLVDQPVSRLPDFRESTTQKQGSAEEQGPVKSVLPVENLTSDRVVQRSNDSSLGYGATLSFSSQPPEKKRPFKMSAHEDCIEMDDRCNEHEPESLWKGLEEPMGDSKSALIEDKALDKSPVSSERTVATPMLDRTELEGGNVMAGESNTGFKFSTSSSLNTSSQKVVYQSIELGNSHVLFSATTTNNLTSVESKVETASSLKNVFSGRTNAVVRVTESDTSITKISELANTVNGNLAEPPSLAFSPMTTNNTVSVDAPSRNLAPNDGPLTSSACLSFTSSVPASVNLGNQSFTNSSSNMASSAVATTSTSALSDSVLVPANGASSSFSERVCDSSFSKNLFSAPSTIGSSGATDVKAEKVNGLGNFSNSYTVSTSAGTNTGFSILGVGTSDLSSTVNSQWPSSPSKTSVSKESSLTESGNANASPSTPVHFGSSSSSMVFGLSGATPVTASVSFGSSVFATKTEGTSQSSGSASTSNQVDSINVAAPVTFKFGGGALGSTTAASLGTFQSGASSATPTSSNTSLFSFNAGSSAPSSAMFSSSTAPGLFSFGAGAGSSSSKTSVSSTTSGVFNFGSAPLVSSSSANAITSSTSTAPAIFSFKASAPALSSDSNKVSSSDPNSSTFASSLQTPKSSVVSPFTMPSSTFGASSPAFGTSNSSMVFGSNNTVPSNPTFVFGSTTSSVPSNPTFAFVSTTSSVLPSAGTQSVFGNSASPFTTTTPGNNDQMSAEDCMAEDPIQSSSPAAPVFGQSFVSPSPPGFMFQSTAPSPGAPFQFASQQSQVGQQNPSQFQASSSSEFNAGGGFSLGSNDKSGRKFVKVNRNRNRKMR